MVQNTIKEINKIAKLHHASLQGKLIVPMSTYSGINLVCSMLKANFQRSHISFCSQENAEINNNEKIAKSDLSNEDIKSNTVMSFEKDSAKSNVSITSDEMYFSDVVVQAFSYK